MGSEKNECRFCLKKMENEKMALIDEEIHGQFMSITQIELNFGMGLSQIICEVCLRSLQLANAVKYQFIENQRKLNEYNPATAEDTGSEHEESTPRARPPQRKRKRQNVREKANDDYVDPLQLVSVQEQQQEEETDQHQETFDDYPSDTDTSQQIIQLKEEPLEELQQPIKHEFQPPRRDVGRPKSLKIKNIKTLMMPSNNERNRYQCPHCSNFYKRRPHMLRHIEVQHMHCKYVCLIPECTQYFVRKERLKKHLETCHSDIGSLELAVLLEQVRSMKPIYGNADESTDQASFTEPGSSNNSQMFESPGLKHESLFLEQYD